MSSHHFVREGQEPALLIDTHDVSNFSFLDQIAAWNPVVIAMERSVPTLIANSIHIDYLLTREDADTWYPVLSYFPKLKIHTCPEDYFGAALSKIVSGSASNEVHVLRDELMPEEIDKLRFDNVRITVFTPGAKWIFVQNGEYRSWFAAESRIMLRGKGISVNGAAIEGDYTANEDALLRIHGAGSFWVGVDL
ncbi:MAG: hypothetical protein P8X57_04530 [Cyclobacteriaceae bacterium]